MIECHCANGWTGDVCDGCAAGYHNEGGACVLDESCLASSCSYHGECDDTTGVVDCDCDTGYAEPYCATCDASYHREGTACVVDEVCAADSCGDHGDCTVVDGLIVCVCHMGWDGDACDACDVGYHMSGGLCVADEVCEADTCSDHGTCAVVDGVTDCSCDVGYDGNDCAACYPGYEASAVTGLCQVPCPGGDDWIRCDGTCVYGFSPEHCGGCESSCEGDERCQWDGSAATCECHFSRCSDGTCADFFFNEDYCGDCDTVCADGEKCIYGVCVTYDEGMCDDWCEEQEDSVCCSGECRSWEELLWNRENCGGCGNMCESDESCVAGVCTTGDGVCADPECFPGEQVCCDDGAGGGFA